MEEYKIRLEDIGRRIRMERERLGFTREQLTAKTGLSIEMIKKLENGTTNPKATSIIEICNALNLTSDYILFGDNGADKNVMNIPDLSLLSEKEQIYLREITELFVKSHLLNKKRNESND